MPSTLTAAEHLDREFLEIRCRLLDAAAALDRIDSGGGTVASDDARMKQLVEAAKVLTDGSGDRAVRLQMVFSDSYYPKWRKS